MRTHKPLISPVCNASSLHSLNLKPSSKIGAAILAVNSQTNNLPKVKNNEHLADSVIHNKELKPLAKQIDLVLNEVKAFINNMMSSNASIRPSTNECASMHKGLKQLKDSIVAYKKTALDITSYKHNTKKTDKLNSLIQKSIQLEDKLNKNLENNKKLKAKIANELNKSEREMQERRTRKNDIQDNR